MVWLHRDGPTLCAWAAALKQGQAVPVLVLVLVRLLGVSLYGKALS
jgi:hypothetical protein